MTEYAIIGTQWGDEGKGKVVDLLAHMLHINYVARYNGGNNAGHTVNIGGDEYKFHLLPSAVLHPGIINVIGNGVVVNPKVLFEELERLESKGHKVNLRISEAANLIMPYHIVIDGIEGGGLDTTRRGIGPCYEDKVGRRGIRVCDLMDKETFREKLSKNLEKKNLILTKIYNQQPLSFDEIYNEYIALGEKFKQYVCDTSLLLDKAQSKHEDILFESAQGTMLDVDFGSHPYTTSSNPTRGGIYIGTGITPKLNKVIGVVKAYTTRVGGGPLPTELKDETGEKIRERGKEFGTTTGRARRCGWEDTVVTRYAVRINGIDWIAITKLDVLSQFPTLQICYAYNYDGQTIEDFHSGLDLYKCSPIYEDLPGWLEDISNVRNYRHLPKNTKRYLSRLEELNKKRIGLVSVGPEREQTIIR